MGGATRLLVLALVTSAAACILTQPLNGLTGGGAGGDDAASDVGSDTTAKDAGDGGGGGDGPSAEGPAADAPPDVADGGGPGMDASDGGTASDVVQPDVVTGPVSCADAGVVLCEDFENGLDSTKWPTTDNTNATVGIDGTEHHRGANALHVHAPALSSGSAVNVAGSINHIAPLPSPVFVRAFYMFSSAQPQEVESFVAVVQGESPYYGMQLDLWQTTGDFALTDWTVSPSLNVTNGPASTASTWTCVEWELVPPSSGTSMTTMDLWVNDNEAANLHLTNVTMSDLGELEFGIGFEAVTTLPAYDMWIDDIYVDTSRVGCAK
ncbi:MAG TPA: hypothetical protein VMI75_14930 [Polyangiaceae bacterium]|nr:hypothetical protein [Polyangiaceae bacterium]